LGAILVRPDGYVAWRSEHAPALGEQALQRALGEILGRLS
jgi:aromatic ring hydroxylase-like protein